MRETALAAVCLVALQPLLATQSKGEPPPFVDVTGDSGLDFIHRNAAAGELLLPEVIGAGGALFDYDNDGDLDLFAVQGGGTAPAVSGRSESNGLAVSERRESKGSRLYRNDLGRGRRPRFVDVTEPSGITVKGDGMGAATGDI